MNSLLPLKATGTCEPSAASDDFPFTLLIKSVTNLGSKIVLETGINSVAVAIGTSHGAYKFRGEPHLRIDILTDIEKELGKFPIVLHGASTIDPKIIKQINARGGKIKNAKGVSKDDLKEICKNHNVCKINVDTDLRLAFLASIRQTLKASPKETNPRYFLTEAKEYMKEIVKQKINLFSGKY